MASELMSVGKKLAIWISIFLYGVSYLLQSSFFVDRKKVSAAENPDTINLVAIFVDKDIYPSIQDKLQRYSTSYLQKQISKSKAVVLPIESKNFEAHEISQILENMYFEGNKDESSKLVGTIFIGDIPLPVVQNNGFIYPSIYPYVDFEDQQFIYDSEKKFFIYNDNPNGQAEIWHSIIQFDETEEYNAFFDKIASYQSNPDAFIDKAIRYDDAIGTKKYFIADNTKYYVNSMIFGEDIGYHRYSPLLLNTLTSEHNTDALSIGDTLQKDLEGVEDEDLQDYADMIKSRNDAASGIIADMKVTMPTLTIKKSVDEMLKSYDGLIGNTFLSKTQDNIEALARRYRTGTSYHEINGVTDKMNQVDNRILGDTENNIQPLLIQINDALESGLNAVIEKGGRYLNVPIPVNTLNFKGKKKLTPAEKCVRETYDYYENYFFGKKADLITTAAETSIFKGTYQNLDTLSGQNVTNILGSVGNSYHVFSTQVEANRGYNIGNAQEELDMYNRDKINKKSLRYVKCTGIKALGTCFFGRNIRVADESEDEDICDPEDINKQGGCESMSGFAVRYRGGASPLNLDISTMKLQEYQYQNARFPIYDIAGSQAVETLQVMTGSYKSIETYSNLIQTKFSIQDPQNISNAGIVSTTLPNNNILNNIIDTILNNGTNLQFTNRLPTGNLRHPTWTYSTPKTYEQSNFFTLFSSLPIHKIYADRAILAKIDDGDCGGQGSIYRYKTIDSRVKNIAPTRDQISDTQRYRFKEGSDLERFYLSTKEELSNTDQSIQTVIQQFSGISSTDMTGVISNLLQIKQAIASGNNGMQTILNYSLAGLSTANTTQIANLAAARTNANLHTNSVAVINQRIVNTKQGLNGLFNYLQGISIYNIQYLIDDIIQTQHLKNQEVTLLSGRKTTIGQQFATIGSDITRLKATFSLSQAAYANIGELQNNIIALEAKRNTIAALQGGNGCTANYYKPLCDALRYIIQTQKNIFTVADNNINVKIDQIAQYSGYDEEGTLTVIEPFSSIAQELISPHILQEASDISQQIDEFATAADENEKETIKGMNIATTDRPIDSIRNITFKGVGGDLVQFTYPNLYEVEVYKQVDDTLILKTPGEIIIAIKQYLQKKADEYNTLLNQQREKKDTYFATFSGQFSFIGQLDPLANPQSSIHNYPANPLDQDIFIDQLIKYLDDLATNPAYSKKTIYGDMDANTDDEKLGMIARFLYQQNIARPQKIATQDVGENINETKNSFDINQKITNISYNYLTKNNDQGTFITPTYRSKGYEVAYINTDGQQYISANQVPSFIKQIQTIQAETTTPTPANAFLEKIEQTNQTTIQDCEGVDVNGAAMLFDFQTFSSPWINAMKCRAIQTWKKPLSIKVGFKHALGPVIVGAFSDIKDTLQDFGTQRKEYGTQRSTTDNTTIIDEAPADDQEILRGYNNHALIKTSQNSISIDTGSQTSTCMITAAKDIGRVQISISSTGDNCLMIGQTNLCKQTRKRSQNIYTNPQEFDLTIANKQAGDIVLQIKLCMPNKPDTCISKQQIFQILPGPATKVTLQTIESKTIMEGGILPIQVTAVDTEGNTIGQTTEKYIIRVESGAGTINGTNQIAFNNFSDAKFIYQAPTGIEKNQVVTIYVMSGDTALTKETLRITKGIITVKQGEKILYQTNNGTQKQNTLTYTLPKNESDIQFMDSNAIAQIHPESLPSIEISVRDPNGNAIDTVANIISKQGLLSPGITSKQEGNIFTFKKAKDFIIQGGTLQVAFYPNFRAGNDSITIAIPGKDPITIPIIINPGQAKKVILQLDQNMLDSTANKKSQGTISIVDTRNNKVTTPTTIKIGVIGPATTNISESIYSGNEYTYSITATGAGGEGYVFAYIKDRTLGDQVPGYQKFLVQKTSLPTNDLNVMYLNLFGSDRGNQRGYFSENDHVVTNIISKSEKVLATTTQLIDPAKIKQIKYLLDSHGQIQSIDQEAIRLTIHNGKRTAILGNTAEVNLGATETFVIQPMSDTGALAKFTKNTDTVIYIPEPTDSVTTGNQANKSKIIINGLEILDIEKGIIDPDIQIIADGKSIADMESYTMQYKDKIVGKIWIRIQEDMINQKDRIELYDTLNYGTIQTFSHGSTNIPAIGIYVSSSAYSKQGYISIEDSTDPMLGIGFTSKFKNISNFANGQSVGQATIPYGSQFLVNFGDPLLQRTDTNRELPNTDFDGGIGQTIYTDPKKTIQTTLPIDFNNDRLIDMLIIFTDGTIKLLKNYGGKEGYQDLQELMILTEPIKKIQIGDADGNGREDIIVITSTNKGVVYLNTQGIFSVDPQNICLNINTEPNEENPHPEDFSAVKQLFIVDMDQDGKVDIVTNDSFNDTKIFYGGKSSKGPNYISNSTGLCDSKRYERQKGTYQTVKRFGMQVDNQTPVQDESLIHRRGAIAPSEGIEEEIEEIGIDTSDYTDEQLKKLKDQATQDAQNLVQNLNEDIAIGAAQLAYVQNPLEVSPAYEQSVNPEDIYYMPINQNTGALGEVASIYKEYSDINGGILRDGDLVVIQTTIISKKHNNKLTYIDLLKGPRSISKDKEGKISSLVFNGSTGAITIDRDIAQGYQFVIDNITLQSGQKLSFSYMVTYQGQPITSIDIQDTDLLDKSIAKDKIPDISFASTDPCQKGRWILFNKNSGNKRNYDSQFQDIQSAVDDYNSGAATVTQETLNDLLLQLNDIQNIDDIQSIPGAEQSTEKRLPINLSTPRSAFTGILDFVGQGTTITSNLIDSATAKVAEKMDEALKGLCQGFSLGKNGCQGIPVPFNQAFLGAGSYHIFGCVPKLPNPLYVPFRLLNQTLGKGLPLLAFPTSGTPPIRPPIPAGAGGIFGSETATSQFRLYIVPTLTLGVGIALCGGPYQVGSIIPKPFSDLGGNCIVFGFGPITKCSQENNDATITQNIDAEIEIASRVGTCNNPPSINSTIVMNENNQLTKKTSTSTPLRFVAATSQENKPQYTSAIPQGNFGGLINIDMDPITTISAEGETDMYQGYDLKKGENVQLKVLGAKTKGLVKCVVQDRTTRQIQYIQNNLTKMTIQVDFPDLTTLVQGFDKIGNLKKTYQDLNAADKQSGQISSTSGSQLDINGNKTGGTVGRTQYVSQQELKNISQTIGNNPFEAIQDMFKEVPLINIDTQDITIKVPALTSDDIKKYQNYLMLWIAKNGQIAEDRGDMITKMTTLCSTQEIIDWIKDNKNIEKNIAQLKKIQQTGKLNPEQSQQLQDLENINKKANACAQFKLQRPKFITFQENTAGLITSVKANINILEKYKAFPTQLSQWTHISDRYLTEISAMLEDFTNTTTTRLDTNANRFSQYVDAITLLVGAIKTRQAIIDFSVNRSEKCSKCSNDNYGSFSCSLSFLCPKLPIFPIPAFKIPSIYMDMSHIELGMNIVLPKINFVPTKISLPQLPNIPEPPTIEVDWNIMYGIDINMFEGMSLPSIPVIPEPPVLPEPPSFIPSFQIELPVLPPAPKIPKILPEINGVLKVANFIGKIFCIVKGGIGLVGEKSVKAKVEQITQRTRNVPVFDYFDLTAKFKDPPLEGFDYQMDAYATLKFNFDGVYSVLNNIASITNNMVAKPIESAIQSGVNRVTDKANNNVVTDTGFDIINNFNQNIDFQGYRPSTDDDTDMIDYSTAYQQLKAGLIDFQNSTSDDKTMHNRVTAILATVEHKSVIAPATKQIQQVQQAAQSIIDRNRQEQQALQKEISDYDAFVEELRKNPVVLVNKNTAAANLSTPLFTVDQTTQSILAIQEDPTKTYLTLNQKMVDGYLQAIRTDGAEKLNMSATTYTKSKTYLETTKKEIDKALLAYNDRPMLAQAAEPCENCGDNNSTDNSYSSDISAYVQGVFVETYSGNKKSMVNTVISTEHIESIIADDTINQDINNDGNIDIITHDGNALYIKYAKQNDEYLSKGGDSIDKHYSKFYSYADDHELFKKRYIGSFDELKELTDENGYLSLHDLTIKVVSETKEIKNFQTAGQSFDTLQLSRKNSAKLGEKVDGYVIRISNKIDAKDISRSFRDFRSRGEQSKYILILPQNTEYEKGMINIDDDLIKKRITSQIGNSILAVQYFNPDQDTISITLSDLPRKRLYTSIATLSIDQSILTENQQKVLTLYTKTSPRSNQTVAGLQNLGDTSAPIGETILRRNSINQAVSTGITHEGYINTKYTLKAEWTDNVAVQTMIIQQDGQTIIEKSNDSPSGSIELSGLFFTGATQQQYDIIAIDQNENIARQQVTVKIKIPEIEITELQKSGEETAHIIAKISNDIDEGMIVFQRLRNGIRKDIQGSAQNTEGGFSLSPQQTIITGGIFTLGNDIGLYDAQGNELASIDPDTGEITINSGYQDQGELYLNLASHIPVIELRDIQKHTTLFQITLPIRIIEKIQLHQSKPEYELIKLPEGQFGDFSNGYCLKNSKNDCVLYTNNAGAIYIPGIYASALKGQYYFDQTTQKTQYIIQDQTGKELATLIIQLKQQ